MDVETESYAAIDISALRSRANALANELAELKDFTHGSVHVQAQRWLSSDNIMKEGLFCRIGIGKEVTFPRAQAKIFYDLLGRALAVFEEEP